MFAGMYYFVVCLAVLGQWTVSCATAHPTRYPIVLWHGMGDSCCNPLSLGGFASFLEKLMPGVYVKSLEIGKGIEEDTYNGFFKNANDQVEEACRQIAANPKLQHGYNAIGFSQGALFLRAVAQRCPNGMRTLISLGGQHQGIFGFPQCNYPDNRVCDLARYLLRKGAYVSFVQHALVQAQFWHDPLDEEIYKQDSIFLADINNERSVNETYKTSLISLRNLVLVKFDKDSMVVPRESSWFGFYAPGQGTAITSLQDSDLYEEDRLGLQYLDREGKLQLLTCPGDHLHMTKSWFKNKILPYLKEIMEDCLDSSALVDEVIEDYNDDDDYEDDE